MITNTNNKQPITGPELTPETQPVNQAQNVKTVDKVSGPSNSTGINNLQTNSQIPSGVKNHEDPACSVKLDKHSAPIGQTFSQNKIQNNITGTLATDEPKELETFLDQDAILKLIDSDHALKNMVNDLKRFYLQKPEHNVLHVLCAFVYNFFVGLLGHQTTTLGQDDLAKQTEQMLHRHPEILIFYNTKNMGENNFHEILKVALERVNDQNKLLTDDELKLYPQTILETFKQCNTPDLREMSVNMYNNLEIIQESFMPLIKNFQDKITFNGKEVSGTLLFKGNDDIADNELKKSFNQQLDKAVNTFLSKLNEKASGNSKAGNFCISQFRQSTTAGEKKKDEIIGGIKHTYGNTISAEGMASAAAEYVFGMACNTLDHDLIPDLDQKFDNAPLRDIDARNRSVRYLILRGMISRTIEERLRSGPQFDLYKCGIEKQEDAQKMLIKAWQIISPGFDRLKSLTDSNIWIHIDRRFMKTFTDDEE